MAMSGSSKGSASDKLGVIFARAKSGSAIKFCASCSGMIYPFMLLLSGWSVDWVPTCLS
jgi:hypothetical protein